MTGKELQPGVWFRSKEPGYIYTWVVESVEPEKDSV